MEIFGLIKGKEKGHWMIPNTAECLIPNSLYVLSRTENIWCDFVFIRWSGSNIDGSDSYGEILFHGSGPLGNLNECRHIYWGNDGYIFYPSFSQIITALQWLKNKGFELD